MNEFLYGATTLGCLVAGLFFLRFWRETADRLFVYFALAFWTLGVNYALLALVSLGNEWRLYVFMVRLAAFCLIVYGIIEKNRR